jgi:hypothetical protein
MSDSIVLSSAIYKFTLNKIAFKIEYSPNETNLEFLVSANTSSGINMCECNSDLAIALNELFEVVNG